MLTCFCMNNSKTEGYMLKLLRAVFILSCLLMLIFQHTINIAFAANIRKKKDRMNSKLRYAHDVKYLDIGVQKVLNGDTLRLENGETLRLIGIDTPELIDGNKLEFDSKVSNIPVVVLKVMGNEAMRFVEQLIDGKRIRIEFDKKRKDNYGDLLGYVFVIPEQPYNQEEIFLNAQIIKNGYTYQIDTTPNTRYSELFIKMHEHAKTINAELWQQWRQQN